jgi:hypothetical protein
MGPGPRVRDWSAAFDGGEEVCYRGSIACTLRGGLPSSYPGAGTPSA